MHQARQVSTLAPALPDSHSQGAGGQVGAHWPVGGLPADDPPGVDVGGRRPRAPGRSWCARRRGYLPRSGGMSATHSPHGAKASKWRLTRSAGHWSSRSRARSVRRFGAPDTMAGPSRP